MLAWVAGLGAFFMPFEELTIDASYDYAVYDTRTDVVRFIDGVPTNGKSEFESSSHTGGLNIEYKVVPQFTLTGGLRLANVLGDFKSYRVELRIGGEYFVTEMVALGAEARWYNYEESGRGWQNYDAWNLDLWMRVHF